MAWSVGLSTPILASYPDSGSALKSLKWGSGWAPNRYPSTRVGRSGESDAPCLKGKKGMQPGIVALRGALMAAWEEDLRAVRQDSFDVGRGREPLRFTQRFYGLISGLRPRSRAGGGGGGHAHWVVPRGTGGPGRGWPSTGSGCATTVSSSRSSCSATPTRRRAPTAGPG